MRNGYFANDNAREKERFVAEVVDVVGFVDTGMGDNAVGVGADGGFDVIFCRCEDSRKG